LIVSIGLLLQITANAREAISRSFLFIACFSRTMAKPFPAAVREAILKAMKAPRKDSPPAVDRREELLADLARRIALFMGSAENRATDIPALALHRRTAPTGPCSMTYEPGMTVIAQGRKRVDLGRTTFVYGGSRYLLTSADLPIVIQVVEASERVPCLALSLRLDMPLIRELLSREELHQPEAPSDKPAMATGEVTVQFLSACSRLIELLDAPGDIPFLNGLIQREIIYRILRSPEGARLRAIATLGDQSNRTVRAIAWIRANYSRPLRVEDLAQIAGMGISTLHHHFRALTAMSPVQYQKQLRLQAARARMLAEGLDAASAAFEVGYESASQFNREYSRFFGQPPMRDIRTLLSPDAPPLESVAAR
jgi:AraC-like DNA-binding protein